MPSARRIAFGALAILIACGERASISVPPVVEGGADATAPSVPMRDDVEAGGGLEDARVDAHSDARDAGADRDARPPDGDGGAGSEGGPGGDTARMTCGMTSCDLSSERCCIYPATLPPPEFFFRCVAGLRCPTHDDTYPATELTCASRANCSPGLACCIIDYGLGLHGSECRSDCAGNEIEQLCEVAAPDSGCPPTLPCSQTNIRDWGLPSGYATCGGHGS